MGDGESALVRTPSLPALVGEKAVALALDSVTIVIPAFNEEGAIAEVLTALKASLPANVREIIVADDGSSDKTGALATAAGVRVLKHTSNRGYGASLKTAIRAASTEYVLCMDADGQHRVEDVAQLCALVHASPELDLVIGHRSQLLHSPLWRMPGKWFLTRFAEFLSQKNIPDLNSGLRIIRTSAASKYLSVCPSGFSFSTTMTMALLSRGFNVSWSPIQVKARIGKSTVSVKTGFQTIMLVLRLAALFNPLRIFLPASALFVGAGVAWGVPYIIAREGVTVGSMLSILAGILLFALGIISDQIAQLRLERYE